MKLRNGFVSNSSSSSFVVIAKERHADPVTEIDDIIATKAKNYVGHPYIKSYDVLSEGALFTDISRFTDKQKQALKEAIAENHGHFEVLDVLSAFDGDREIPLLEFFKNVGNAEQLLVHGKELLTGFTISMLNVDQCSSCEPKEIIKWIKGE